MALNDSAFVSGVTSLLADLYDSDTQSTADARTQFANELKGLIKDYVKSMTITIPSNTVNVAGSSTNQTNPSSIILNNVVS